MKPRIARIQRTTYVDGIKVSSKNSYWKDNQESSIETLNRQSKQNGCSAASPELEPHAPCSRDLGEKGCGKMVARLRVVFLLIRVLNRVYVQDCELPGYWPQNWE